MKTFAIVLRGIIHGRARGRQRTVNAISNILDNFIERIVVPIAQLTDTDIRIHVYMCTYDFDGISDLERKVRTLCQNDPRTCGRVEVMPTFVYNRPVESGTQLYAMREAMHHLVRVADTCDDEPYYGYIVCRPDTVWKCNVTDMLTLNDPTHSWSHITYLFPERTTPLRKNSTEFISDVFFAIPGPKLHTEFMPALEFHDVNADLHGVYESAKIAATRAARAIPIWKCCIDQRFDSNTDNMTNPFYVIHRSMSSYNVS